MNKIDALFKNRSKSVLSIYLTAGFPKIDSLSTIIPVLEKSGVDLLEIGMPFSDPLADGPVIQQASQQALENGMNLNLLFEQLEKIPFKIPVILMGYLNPVIQYGIERFLRRCKAVGVSGTILPDLPIPEYLKYQKVFEENGIHNVLLVTPQTSSERVIKLASLSRGFLYVVSSSSTTGTRSFAQVESSYFEKLKQLNLQIPRMIGFGIQSRQDFKRAGELADGAIIGTRFIQLLFDKTTDKDDDIESHIVKFVRGLRTE